jgi:hypothetical protein
MTRDFTHRPEALLADLDAAGAVAPPIPSPG